MMRDVRRFTDAGVLAAKDVLTAFDNGELPDVDALLSDSKLTEDVGIEIEVRPFRNRRDAADHLVTSLAPLDSSIDVSRDRGLWTWLGLAWLDLLAPVQLGARMVREHWRWVLAVDDYQKYSRHLLAGPYFVALSHRDDLDRAMAVLVTKVESPGEIVAQLTTRYDIVRSPGIMLAATELYVDPSTTTGFKRGAGGAGAGSPRRLAEVLLQFELTWDVVGMTAEQILQLLPAEFDRFRPSEHGLGVTPSL
jgi:hypothetical protein